MERGIVSLTVDARRQDGGGGGATATTALSD